MQICGVEVDYNHYDTSNMKTFELNHKKLIEDIAEVEKLDCFVYEKSEKVCELIIRFFTDLFGVETTDKIITNKRDMKMCINAFAELFAAINSEVNETNKSFEKYSLKRVQHTSRRFT